MIDHAEKKFREKPPSFETIDALPQELGFKNPFLALPVLAQATYGLLAGSRASDVKSAMVLAVNHSGDSDSVGAIVGNILGARHGASAVPRAWADILLQRREIDAMANIFTNALYPPALAPAPKNDARPQP